MRKFVLTPGFFTFVFLIANLFFASVVFGQTVTTDLPDYQPGETVNITGTGFNPSETVTLLVEHVGDEAAGTDPQYHQPWDVDADGDGNFVASWGVPIDGDALGSIFILTADGHTSPFLHAEVFFTDAIFTWDGGDLVNDNWNDPDNWSPNSVPTAGDAVIIPGGFTNVHVNIPNAVCAALNITSLNTSSAAATLIFDSGSQLTVTGAVVVGSATSGNREGTITMTAGGTLICNSLTLGNEGASTPFASEIIQGSGSIITVTSTATILQPNNNSGYTNRWGVNAGTATVTGVVTLSDSSAGTSRVGSIVITTGTFNANGGISILGATSTAANRLITMSGGASGILNIDGNGITFANASNVTFAAGTGTSLVNYNALGAQTVGNFTYNNLTLSGSGSKTLANSIIVNGNLSVNAAAILTLSVASNRISDATSVVLGGGTFRTGITTGFSETVGTLSLTAGTASTIALGTGGHTLNFANSSGLTPWDAGATLTITGWTGTPGATGAAGKVFFDNSATALTVAQLAKISFILPSGTFQAMLLNTGELVPQPLPTWTITGDQTACVGVDKELTFSVNVTGTHGYGAFRINFPATFALSSASVVSIGNNPPGLDWASSIDGSSVCLTRLLGDNVTTGGAIVFKVTVNASTAAGAPFSLSGFSNIDSNLISNTCPSPNDGPAQSATTTVAVTAPPSQPGTISGPTQVCPNIGNIGDNENIGNIAYSVSTVSGATSYTWTVPTTGWSITSGQGTNSVAVASGALGQNGDITVTANNTCPSAPRILSVTIFDANDIGFNDVVSTNTLIVCAGTLGTILGGNPTNGQNFQWQVDDNIGFSSPSNVSAVGIADSALNGNDQEYEISSTYYNIPDTYYFRRVITNNTNCNGGSDVVTFVVNANPIVGALTGNQTVCVDATTEFSRTLPTTLGGAWTSNNPGVASVIGGVVTGVSAGSANIIYTVTNASNCATVVTRTVTVNPLPIITTLTASPTTLCVGNSSNLVLAAPVSAPETIVNYDFNSGTTYSGAGTGLTPVLATDITSAVSSPNINFATVNSGTNGGAFTTNATSGNALNNVNPPATGTWSFTISGSVLKNYSAFKLYFQAQRNSGGDNTVVASFSKDGGAPVNIGTVSLTNSGNWYVGNFTLNASSNNPSSTLVISLVMAGGGSGDIKIDNFQIQAVPQNAYSWTATPSGASAGLPINSDSALGTNSNITVSPTITTDYTVTSKTPNGCIITDNVTVNVNTYPVLGAVGNKSVDEETALTFTASATDADLPAQNLTYSLDAVSVTAGMSINTSTGAFSWTPSEVQGGTTYPVTISVTDNGTCSLIDTETIIITVNEVNVAPVLAAISNKSVDEEIALSFNNSATDHDLPAQTLAYSLDATSLAAGMTIDGSTGVFSWTPTESEGGITYHVTIIVTDNGTNAVNLSASKTFDIVVSEVNVVPVLTAIGGRNVNEQSNLAFSATATDHDIPKQTLKFTLDDASIAKGMSITAGGAFSWTPTEAQGGTSYDVTITVTDNEDNEANHIDFETFNIVVAEVNVAPVLAAVGNKNVDEETQLTFTATVTDQDLPAQELTFSLVDAPAGASITAAGVFTWNPTEAQGAGSYKFKVKVTDTDTALVPVNLSHEEEITVTVNEVNVAPELAEIGNKTTVWGNELTFTATATDHDSNPVNILIYSLVGAPVGASINDLTGAFSWTPTEAQGAGSYTFTIKVADDGINPNNLTAEESITVTVTKRITQLVYNGDLLKQYSDQANLSATLSDITDGLPGTPVSGKTITFVIGSQSVTATTDSNGIAANTLILTQSPTPVYNVISTYIADVSYFGSNDDNDVFDITQENDPAFYTGPEFASTGTATATTAKLRLTALVTDHTDGYPGDIKLAIVSFVITPYDCSSMIVGTPITVSASAVALVNPADNTIGTAFYDYTFDIGTCNAKIFDVKVCVSGYYTAVSDVSTITVAKSLNDFVTGGGHHVFAANTSNVSCGPYKSDDGSKTNFGFNVKYNKTGTNLQGNVNVIIRSGGNVYQMKGIVGGTNGSLATNVSDLSNKRAVLTTKSSMINVATGLAVPDGSKATMELRMNDKGEPGAKIDTFIIKVWGESGALLYSSSCSNAEVPINGGNIQVRSTITGLPTTTTLVSSPTSSTVGNPVTFTATVSRGSSVLALSGIVTFKDGTTTLGTGAVGLNGTAYKAAFTTSALTAGNHPITAVFSGDAKFNSSTSAVLTQTVIGIGTKVSSTDIVKTVVIEPVLFNVMAYPNPTDFQFTLTIEGGSNEKIQIEVFDMFGRSIRQFESAYNQLIMFGEDLPLGTYLAIVSQGANRKTLKLVKE